MSDDSTPSDATTKPKPRKTAARKRKAPVRKKAAATQSPAPESPAPAIAGAVPHVLIEVPMPVRWRDLDAFNHVNNSKYLSYLEEARLHWMLGVPGQGLDDHVAPERLGNTSLTIGHRIVDAEDADTLYCDGHVVMVWIDRQTGQAAPLPPAVRDACQA